MRLNCSRLVLGLAAILAAGAARPAAAAPVQAKLNLTNLRCIQNYAPTTREDDQVYVNVTGVAKGADVNTRVPETGTLPANTKTPPVSEDKPVTLWEGELADGEFAFLTVTLFQGNGDDAGKAFDKQLADAAKGVAERSKKTLTAEEAKSLTAATLKAQQGVVTAVKETLSRDKGTDHFNGLFNVLLFNDKGKLVKRVDPVGLTFGEHFGENEKIYTKIKHTRNNVSVKDADGQYYPQSLPPISEDKLTIRVKMLETEYFKNEAGRRTRNVTDYLADIQVHAGGKPQEWKLGGEHIGPSQTHLWWEWAE